MPCVKCDELLGEYATLTLAHAKAATRLAGKVEDCEMSEYIELKNAINQVRLDLEAARSEFERHKLSHAEALISQP